MGSDLEQCIECNHLGNIICEPGSHLTCYTYRNDWLCSSCDNEETIAKYKKMSEEDEKNDLDSAAYWKAKKEQDELALKETMMKINNNQCALCSVGGKYDIKNTLCFKCLETKTLKERVEELEDKIKRILEKVTEICR
jgi:hypothetical protein